MKPILKINKSIEYLGQISEILDTMFYHPRGENDELLSFIEKEDNKGRAIIKYYEERYGKSIFRNEEDAIQHIYNKHNVLERQEEALRLLRYNLFPFLVISTKNNSFSDDKKGLKKLLELKDNEVENVIEHLENREIVYYKDVVIEMEDFPENLDNAGKYLNMISRKYKRAFQNVPNEKHYNWEYFMQGKNDSEHYKGIGKLLKVGLLTEKEAEMILFNAWLIVEKLNLKISLLKDKYNNVKYIMGIDKEEHIPPFDFKNNFDGTDKEKNYKYFKATKEDTVKTASEKKRTKFIANEYALAYIFDLWANGEQIPQNRIEGGNAYNELLEIGKEKGFERPDTFYRAILKLRRYDLNSEIDLERISVDWANAVKTLSKDWSKVAKYLKGKGIRAE